MATVTPAGTNIHGRAKHPPNAPAPISSTEEGMSKLCSFEHAPKALPRMYSRAELAGKVMVMSAPQWEKADVSIVVSAALKLTVTSEAHSWKASVPIVCSVLGNEIDWRPEP